MAPKTSERRVFPLKSHSESCWEQLWLRNGGCCKTVFFVIILGKKPWVHSSSVVDADCSVTPESSKVKLIVFSLNMRCWRLGGRPTSSVVPHGSNVSAVRTAWLSSRANLHLCSLKLNSVWHKCLNVLHQPSQIRRSRRLCYAENYCNDRTFDWVTTQQHERGTFGSTGASDRLIMFVSLSSALVFISCSHQKLADKFIR